MGRGRPKSCHTGFMVIHSSFEFGVFWPDLRFYFWLMSITWHICLMDGCELLFSYVRGRCRGQLESLTIRVVLCLVPLRTRYLCDEYLFWGLSSLKRTRERIKNKELKMKFREKRIRCFRLCLIFMVFGLGCLLFCGKFLYGNGRSKLTAACTSSISLALCSSVPCVLIGCI